MKRLYYIAECIEDVEAVTHALHSEGIRDWHFHVLAKDEAGLYTHKIHSANPIQQLDFLHTAGRYAVVGLVAGLVLAAMLFGLNKMGWVTLPIDTTAFLILAVVGFLFGAWEGGMVGLTRENYKIERFHDDIEAGRYLIMVDVSRQQRPNVKELMNFDFPHIPYRGGSNTGINLLHTPKVLHHQTTH